MQTQEIVDAIFDVKTNGELNELFTAIRDARKALAVSLDSSDDHKFVVNMFFWGTQEE